MSFSRDLDHTTWNSFKNDDMDTFTNNITEHITKLAKNIFQIKK